MVRAAIHQYAGAGMARCRRQRLRTRLPVQASASAGASLFPTPSTLAPRPQVLDELRFEVCQRIKIRLQLSLLLEGALDGAHGPLELALQEFPILKIGRAHV